MSPSCRFYHIKMCTPRVLYRTKNYHGWFHLNFWHCLIFSGGFSDGSVVKNPPAIRRRRFNPWVGKIPWRRRWQSTPVFLPGKSHGQRSLAGYSPWGRKESDTSYQLSNSTNLKTMVLSVLACFILFRDLLRLARPVSHVQLCPSISGGLLPGLPPPSP